jgi:hypothetical protein
MRIAAVAGRYPAGKAWFDTLGKYADSLSSVERRASVLLVSGA